MGTSGHLLRPPQEPPQERGCVPATHAQRGARGLRGVSRPPVGPTKHPNSAHGHPWRAALGTSDGAWMFNNMEGLAAAHTTALTVIRVSRSVTDVSRSLAHTSSFSRGGKATRELPVCGSV